MKVVLASASPRRLALLEQVGVAAQVCPADLKKRQGRQQLRVRWLCTMLWANAALWWLLKGTQCP